MKRFFILAMIVFFILNTPVQARLTVGPFIGTQILKKAPYADTPTYGLSGFVPLFKHFEFSGEYQTFGSRFHYGPDYSYPGYESFEMRNNHRAHQLTGGFHYKFRAPASQPNFLMGFHFGYEWRYNNDRTISIPIGQDEQNISYKEYSSRMLFFTSATFKTNYDLINFFFQYRLGYSYFHRSAIKLSHGAIFGQLSGGIQIQF